MTGTDICHWREVPRTLWGSQSRALWGSHLGPPRSPEHGIPVTGPPSVMPPDQGIQALRFGSGRKKKKRKEGEAVIGAERVCSLTLKAGSICQDISERVLGAIKESQYIGHQHGGSLSHSPRDLSPSQGHTSGPKSISFGNPRQPLFICDKPWSPAWQRVLMWFPWAEGHGSSVLTTCLSQDWARTKSPASLPLPAQPPCCSEPLLAPQAHSPPAQAFFSSLSSEAGTPHALLHIGPHASSRAGHVL